MVHGVRWPPATCCAIAAETADTAVPVGLGGHRGDRRVVGAIVGVDATDGILTLASAQLVILARMQLDVGVCRRGWRRCDELVLNCCNLSRNLDRELAAGGGARDANHLRILRYVPGIITTLP